MIHIAEPVARVQAAWLQASIEQHAPAFDPAVARWMLRIIADPRTGSDMVLILADALREAACEYEATRMMTTRDGTTLRRVADLLAELAPSRAQEVCA